MSEPLFDRDALSYQASDVVAGRYRVTGVLGRGGFGAVYAAQHTGTQQPIALKMLTSDGDEESEARFYREARITAALSSPNTVRVFDVGRADRGPLFIAMEMLKGPTLEHVLKKLEAHNRVMSEQQAATICVSMLNSLAEAHAAGLVHRDLKPANIMLAQVSGSDPVVKVLDFGCSSTADSDLTLEGTVMGTPGYMSPEQCRGEAVDPRSDIYAVGVMLYRCATGRLPFVSDQPLTLIYKHVSEAIPDPRTVSTHNISDTMAELLLRALAKDPNERFADAQQMRMAFRNAMTTFGAHVRSAGDGHTQIQGRRSDAHVLSNLLGTTFDDVQDSLKRAGVAEEPTPTDEIFDGNTLDYQTGTQGGGEAAAGPATSVAGSIRDGEAMAPAMSGPAVAEAMDATASEEGEAVAAAPPATTTSRGKNSQWALVVVLLILVIGAGLGLRRLLEAPDPRPKGAPNLPATTSAPPSKTAGNSNSQAILKGKTPAQQPDVPALEADASAAPAADASGHASDAVRIGSTPDAGAAPVAEKPPASAAKPRRANEATKRLKPRPNSRRPVRPKAPAATRPSRANKQPATKRPPKARRRLRGAVMDD
ncbi:MAG: protein kinase [Myxococcales bacterium]|nr:protein kinase [Myxococcales bacterium]